MAAVNCAHCSKSVSDTEGKCPYCGKPVKAGVLKKNLSLHEKLRPWSSIIMGISCVLLFLELFNVAETYVGALLFGIGFMMSGQAQRLMEKEENYKGKKIAGILIGIAVFIIITGIVFIYLDLK